MGEIKRLGREVRRFELSLRERNLSTTQHLLLVDLAQTLRRVGRGDPPLHRFTDHRGRWWEIHDLATAAALIPR